MNKFVINKNSPEIKKISDKLKLEGYKEHNIEQILFRINSCLNCFEEKKCNNCLCNPLDKIIEPKSCNPKFFPNILNNEKWIEFKKEHNIEIL